MDHSIKIKIGIIFIALSSLVSSILLVLDKDVDMEHFKFTDQVVLHEEHFAGLKNILPENAVAGYITDLQPDENTIKGYGYYLSQFYLTQYVFSPAILVQGANYPLVLGHYHGPVDVSRIYRESKLVLIRDLGNGAMLFRKEELK